VQKAMKDDGELVDEPFLKSIGWKPVGNTWYTGEEDCNTPIVFWVRVDRSLRVSGLDDWKISEPTRGQFRLLLAALMGHQEPHGTCFACGWANEPAGNCSRPGCYNSD
jgi:hypothetical protein